MIDLISMLLSFILLPLSILLGVVGISKEIKSWGKKRGKRK